MNKEEPKGFMKQITNPQEVKMVTPGLKQNITKFSVKKQ